MKRLKFITPTYNDAICNIEFMVGVLERDIWLPRGSERQYNDNVTTPPKDDVQMTLISHLHKTVARSATKERKEAIKKLIKAIEKYKPQVKFMLEILATVYPDCDYFSASYVAPKKSRLEPIPPLHRQFKVQSSLLSQLPDQVRGRYTVTRGLLTKSEKERNKLAKMDWKIECLKRKRDA